MKNSPFERIPRRRWLAAGAGAVSTLAWSAAAAQPNKAPETRLRLAAAWPDKMPGLSDAVRRWAQRVNTLSGGQLQIDVRFSGESGIPPLQLLDAVASGQVDMAHGTAYYWSTHSPGFPFFATVPFGMNANEHTAWLRFGGGMALWTRLGRAHGVVPLACGNTGVQTAGWMREKITSLASLKGLRLRYPGLGGEVLRRLGAVTVNLAASEIVPALASGKIDGAEWVSPWCDMQLGLHEVCNYCYVPGIHEPGHTTELIVNPKVWERLSPWQQEIMRAAGWQECTDMLAQFNHENARSLQTLRQFKNVEMLRLPNDVTRAFRQITPQVLREAVQGDTLAQEIHRSYTAYLQNQLRWAEVADRAYWQARYA